MMSTESALHNSNAHSSNNTVEFDTTGVDQPSEETMENQMSDEIELKTENDTKPLQQMTFRLRNKRVEVEKTTNLWAGQCQSKVVQKLVNGHDKYFILLENVVSKFLRPCKSNIAIL
jgi:hypothetical protein